MNQRQYETMNNSLDLETVTSNSVNRISLTVGQ